MHPRVTAQRADQAQERTRAAAETLAARFALPAEVVERLNVTDRDPETQRVLRQEAVADLLERLAGAPLPAAKGKA